MDDIYARMHITLLFTIEKNWEKSKWLSTTEYFI